MIESFIILCIYAALGIAAICTAIMIFATCMSFLQDVQSAAGLIVSAIVSLVAAIVIPVAIFGPLFIGGHNTPSAMVMVSK